MALDDGLDIATTVKRARAAKGMSQPQLARRVGTSQQTIDKIEKGAVKHSSFLPAIATELGIPVDRVMRFGHKDGAIATIPGHTLVMGERDLPVYVAIHNGVGVQMLSSEPVEYVSRPEPLARVRNGYAVLVPDNTMAPEMKADDIALVNPNLQPRVDDTCVFKGAEGAVCIAVLTRVSDTHWHVETHQSEGRHPPLKRSDWSVAHVVIGCHKRR